MFSRLGANSFGLARELECESTEDLSDECLLIELKEGLSNEPNDGLSKDPSGANFFNTGSGFFNPEPPRPTGVSGAYIMIYYKSNFINFFTTYQGHV